MLKRISIFIIATLALAMAQAMPAFADENKPEAKTPAHITFTSLKEQATEIVSERTQVQKVFDNHDGTKQYIISSGPLHYKEGDRWEDIDTTIESGKDGQSYEMSKSIYKVKFNKSFQSGKIVHIEKDGYGISVLPGELFWSNEKGEREVIGFPQAIEGTVKANLITYPNAYGPGLDFSYEANDINLIKKLIVPDLRALPTLGQKILEGGGPVLALNIGFELDKEMDIYIDSNLWDKKETKIKGKNIEFKKDGKTLWRFAPPKAWDSQGKDKNATGGTVNLTSNGKKLNLIVSFPYSWLKTAQYPVTIDPDTYYGATTDGIIQGFNANYATSRSTSWGFGTTAVTFTVGQQFDGDWYTPNRSYLEFDTSAIDDAATVSQANLYLTVSSDFSTTDFTVRVHKYDWTSPIAAGNREANYDGALASTYDADWRGTSGIATNTSYGSSNLDTTWVKKLAGEWTRYSLLSDRDVGANTPTGNEKILVHSQEATTQSYRPYLSITVEAVQGAATTLKNAVIYNAVIK